MQVGVGLLLFVSTEGFAIPQVAVPPTGIASLAIVLWGLRFNVGVPTQG